MKLLAVDDTIIKSVNKESGILNVKSYQLHQKHSNYKATVSQEIVDIIDALKVPRTIDELTEILEQKGYQFVGLSKNKLLNSLRVLVQYGVLIPITESPSTEFAPIIKSDKESVKEIDLAIYDLETLIGSVQTFQDNHPYPDNALDTLKGYSKSSFRPVE